MKNRGFGYNLIHCRSRYSLLNGVLSFRQICEQAMLLGESSVGVVDINNLYGLPDFLETAAEYGIKPAAGAIITTSASPDERQYLFTAYCLNRTGFGRLNSIISNLNYDSSDFTASRYDYDPVRDLLENGWEGLVIISSRLSVLERLRSAGKNDLYAGLYWGMPFDGLLRSAKKMDIPSAALNEIVCLNSSDRRALNMLRAVDRRCSLARLNNIGDPLSPLSGLGKVPESVVAAVSAGSGGMTDFFSAVPETMAETAGIAEAAAGAEILPSGRIFPSYNGMSEEKAAEKLFSLCRQGLKRRYGDCSGKDDTGLQVIALAEKRLCYEMNIICRKGFAGYFLVVWDIVRQAPRTCGRGSAASSIVSYLLGITHVDPIAYNLFFERFLNMDRKDPPDIDIDFPWDEREKALSYVFEKYRGASAMVADHVCFRSRGAAREAAKALGMTETQTDGLMKSWRGGRGESLPREVAEAAALLYGRPRYIGTHPGGVVITPGPISGYTHVQPSSGGLPVSAWEKDGIEYSGLVKIDLLGNRSLAVLRDSIRLANRQRSKPIEWESFQPYSDVRTRRMIESGDTAGIFYIESPATRQLLKKMGSADFEHLVAASSIIRPAANKWINEYVRRLKGGRYQQPSGALKGVLDETYGIMVYQEDVARVAIAAAGFAPGEADNLRKILSKRNRTEKLPDWKKRFIRGTGKNGISANDAEELWDGILSFEGYSFCKSHSASYALVSYRLAWLKLRYPLEFLVSVINNGGGFYSRQVYLNIVRRKGFPVLKPDINKSGADYLIESLSPGIRGLRAGLFQIKELSSDLIHEIIDKRKSGPFRNFSDFIERIPVSYREIRMLIKSGCLDWIAAGLNRPQMFWKYYHRGKSGGDLFGASDLPKLRGYSSAVRLSDELDTLNLFFSKHPAYFFRERGAEFASGVFICSDKLEQYRGKMVSITGTIAACKEVQTSTRRAMSFVSFEDEFSIFETVFFPEQWAAFEAEIARGFAFLITGVVENDMGAEYINTKSLKCLNRF